MHFLDVGQGDAIVIETPADAVMLVDGGEPWAGEEVVVPYLRRLGIRKLDMVVMTHPHYDHIGGLIPVLQSFAVKQILADGQIHTSRTYEDLLHLIDRKNIPFRLARAGDKVEIAGLDEVQILGPDEPFLPGLNNNSVVLRLRYGSVTVLLTGDIEREAEKRILSSGLPVRSTILKVAHHGSRSSSSKSFLKKVLPRLAVIQVGRDNPYGHPHPATLQALEEVTGHQVLRTDILGTIVIAIDGRSYRIVSPASPAEE